VLLLPLLLLLLLLQGEALTAMPDGRCLPAANYRDTVRPLRRMLKQMGRGCLTAGELVSSGMHGLLLVIMTWELKALDVADGARLPHSW
jgi:hypothetical protein